MRHGIFMFPTHFSLGPGELAREVEDRGFDSLWFPEHSHLPTDPASRTGSFGELSRETLTPDNPMFALAAAYEPFVALTAAAAATSTLTVATGVCLVAQRDPIHTAKAVATLDRLSGGRFLFGVGAGWNRAEMAHHGVDPRSRMRRMAEHVQAVTALWTRDEAEFHGEFVDFGPSWTWPKPVSSPRPPVIVGGMGPGVEGRVLDFGDGWLPQNVDADGIEEFTRRIEAFRARAEDAGRGHLPVTMYHAATDAHTLDAYRRIGIDRAVFLVGSAGRDTVLRELDDLAARIGRQ